MDKEEVVAQQDNPRWFIELGWFQQNNRSFSVLAQNYLCAKCSKRLARQGKEIPDEKLLATIKDCCAQSPDFINYKLPILESVFRLFLSNGNEPLDLGELGRQLNERLGGDSYRTSSDILGKLLRRDNYYGLTQVQENLPAAD